MAPTSALAQYYDLLQADFGFDMDWIRTDYRFNSLEEAVQLTRFFFGPELASKVQIQGDVIVPECTGIWWLHQ